MRPLSQEESKGTHTIEPYCHNDSHFLTGTTQCDRTKPCSACCASGRPKECVFEADQTGDYGPISQSYEIRELRRESQMLKKELCDVRTGRPDENNEDTVAHGKSSVGSFSCVAAARKKKFESNARSDNIYFGTPEVTHAIANVCLAPSTSRVLTDLLYSSSDSSPETTPSRTLSVELRASARRAARHIHSP